MIIISAGGQNSKNILVDDWSNKLVEEHLSSFRRRQLYLPNHCRLVLALVGIIIWQSIAARLIRDIEPHS